MEQAVCGVEIAPIWQSIYEDIRRRILCFEMLPGDILSENVLAAQMNVSRAPVREAMARLVEESYVIAYPQRGTVVSLIDPERVRQAVFLRSVLEHAAVDALCHQGLLPEQSVVLEDSLHRQRALLENQKILEMLLEDDAMHHLLYEYTGKPYAEEAFRLLDSDQTRIRYLQMQTFSYNSRVQLSSMSGWENCLLEHRMLLDAIKKGDAEAACLINYNHINALLWNTENLQKIYPQYFSESQPS